MRTERVAGLPFAVRTKTSFNRRHGATSVFLFSDAADLLRGIRKKYPSTNVEIVTGLIMEFAKKHGIKPLQLEEKA